MVGQISYIDYYLLSTSLSAWHSDRHSLADYLVDESINKGVNIFFTLLLNLTCTNFQQRQHLSLEFLKIYLKFYQYRKNNFFNGQILKIQIVQRYLRNIVYVMTGNCFFSCFSFLATHASLTNSLWLIFCL